jgi:hypothetical protein
MGCLNPQFTCFQGKVEEPLCLQHIKDKEVRLAPGVCYPAGTLLTTGQDEDPTVWTAWSIEMGAEGICGILKCDEDLENATVPCPVRPLVMGCVNWKKVNWPTSDVPEEQEAINLEVKKIISNKNCCLIFETFDPGCC